MIGDLSVPALSLPLSKRLSIPEPEIVYHYASLETLMKIVEARQLWATNVRYLNDTSERDTFLSRVPSRLEIFKKEHPELDWAEMEPPAEKQTLGEIEDTPSTISFSEDNDSLNQWRAYCPKGRGVSIGFDVSCLRRSRVPSAFPTKVSALYPFAPTISAGRVEYLGQFEDWKVDDGITQCYEEAAALHGRLDPETRGGHNAVKYLRFFIEDRATFYKDESFASEQEYRVVVGSVHWQSSLLKFRCNDWSIVPYIPVAIPNRNETPLIAEAEETQDPAAWDAIRQIVVGPTADKDLTAKTLQAFLRSKGMAVPVATTRIPFRDW